MTHARHPRPATKRWALFLLALAQFVVVLDVSVMNVALPTIGRDLAFAAEDLSWVINAYALVFGGLLLLGGRLADVFGARRVFIAGLGIFAAASLAGSLSASDLQLILSRGAQGLGAALLSPAALALVALTFPEPAERRRALGVWGAVAGMGGAAGVLLGGVLTTELGWESVLLINVPVGVLAAAAAPAVLPAAGGRPAAGAFDVAGGLAVTAGLGALVFGVVGVDDAGWDARRTVAPIAGGLVLLALFVLIESRATAPLVPPRLVRRRTLSIANVTTLLFGMSLYSMFLLGSLYMQQILGYSALETGLAYLPISLVIVIASGVAAPLVGRVGVRGTLLGGLTLLAAGLVNFANVSVGGSFVSDVLGPSLVAGVGIGLAFVPLSVAALSDVAEDEAGVASGLFNTSQQFGGVLGVALLSAVAFAGAPASSPGGAVTIQGLQEAFLLGAALVAAAIVMTAVGLRAAHAGVTEDDARAATPAA